MKRDRLFVCALGIGAAVGVASCGHSGNPMPVPSPSPSAAVVNYSALGASDAIGTGASKPCPTGGSPAMPSPPSCPGGTGYVPDIARQLTNAHTVVNLADLGISGAVIGPDLETLGNAHGRNIQGNILQNELPKLPANTTVVTIFTGGDDTLTVFFSVLDGAGTADVSAFIASEIQSFGTDYTTLIAGIRAKAPLAKIVVANVPNLAGLPFAALLPGAQKQILQQVSVGVDTSVINVLASQGIPVIDLLCDPRSYESGNLSIDGFHPNDNGYSILASLIVTAITSPTYPMPQATCPQMNIARSAARR